MYNDANAKETKLDKVRKIIQSQMAIINIKGSIITKENIPMLINIIMLMLRIYISVPR